MGRSEGEGPRRRAFIRNFLSRTSVKMRKSDIFLSLSHVVVGKSFESSWVRRRTSEGTVMF